MSSNLAVKKMLLRLLESNLKQVTEKKIAGDNLNTYVEAYQRELSDFPDELISAASQMYIAKGTFFPSVGQIIKEANKIKMTSLSIPTGNQAWAQVLGAIKQKEAAYCDEGADLRDNIGVIAGYWHPLVKYDEHREDCKICKDGGIVEEYDHPAVEATVKMFGGRDALFTEYMAADRARFIDAYKEVVERETYKATMPNEVKAYIETEESNRLSTGKDIKTLSAKLSVRK